VFEDKLALEIEEFCDSEEGLVEVGFVCKGVKEAGSLTRFTVSDDVIDIFFSELVSVLF
jgi:hypothetical protein